MVERVCTEIKIVGNESDRAGTAVEKVGIEVEGGKTVCFFFFLHKSIP